MSEVGELERAIKYKQTIKPDFESAGSNPDLWDIYFQMDIACRNFWKKRNMPYPTGSWKSQAAARKKKLGLE